MAHNCIHRHLIATFTSNGFKSVPQRVKTQPLPFQLQRREQLREFLPQGVGRRAVRIRLDESLPVFGYEYQPLIALRLRRCALGYRLAQRLYGFRPEWTTPFNSGLGTRIIYPTAIQIYGLLR